MASFVVMEPPGSVGPSDRAVFVRDGFYVLAFLVTVFWFAVHRCWLAALAGHALEGLLRRVQVARAVVDDGDAHRAPLAPGSASGKRPMTGWGGSGAAGTEAAKRGSARTAGVGAPRSAK